MNNLLQFKGKTVGIRSIIDNDLYKFSMGHAVLRLFPNRIVSYKFNDRRGKGNWTKEAVAELQRRINAMADLALTGEERAFCEEQMPWLNRSYWDFLAAYRFDPSEVKVKLNRKHNLEIGIHGLWCRTILWEVPLLSLVSEVYYDMIDTNWTEDGQEEKMALKATRLRDAGVAWGDFGTRRRRHFEAQERVVRIGKEFSNFTGSSNVYLAMLHKVKPIGTMAHEWIMGHSAIYGLSHANKFALTNWNKVYEGNLGTALPDTYGTKAFLRDFNGVLARLFDSVRHDSGDPLEWAQMMIDHYTKLKIDWKAKPLGFTDGNTVESAIEINEWVKVRGGRCWFGIGTSMSNDYEGSPAVSIVIKLSEVFEEDGTAIPVVKLSDNPEKASGDRDAVRVALWTFYRTPLDELKKARIRQSAPNASRRRSASRLRKARLPEGSADR